MTDPWDQKLFDLKYAQGIAKTVLANVRPIDGYWAHQAAERPTRRRNGN